MAGHQHVDYLKSYEYNRSQVGDFYEKKWGRLQPREISWLNKFMAPLSPFMELAVLRDAAVRLYLAVMPELERRSKEADSTLPRDAKALESMDKEFAYYQRWNGYRVGRSLAGPKAGATVYYTIFGRCANAVRARFDMEEVYDSYFTVLLGADESFDTFFGERLDELLPPLAAAIPPLDEATEIAINQFETTRWELRFEALRGLLPANPADFAHGVFALGRQNERNPVIAPLYLEAARQLGELGHDPEQVVRLYFHYLHYGHKYRYSFNPKPLLKRLEKKLFPRPEQLARYQALRQELLRSRDLAPASEAVPTIWQRERKKIALDPAAVHAARARHAGTVELLNEYLQDTPEPAPGTGKPAPTPAKPAKVPAPNAPAAARKATKIPEAADGAGTAPAPSAVIFAPGLTLTAPQQALLHLFAARRLALPQAAVEAFANQHGMLRNQLIDGLNEACAKLLDDVLIEESGDGYAIYPPYYQKITA